MMMKHKALFVAAFLILSLIMPVALVNALTSGNSGGTAIVGNAAPQMSSPAFTDVASADKNNSAVDVYTEYWISYTIRDNNTLVDLTTLTFKVWGANSTVGGADDAAKHYTFTYTQATDTWAETGPGSSIISANCTDPADQSATSGDFRLAFKLQKVADYSGTTTAWRINTTVIDDSSASAFVASLFFGVNYYAEITVVDTSHAWAGLSPGSVNATLTTPADGGIDLTITSNHSFSLQAEGSGDLTSDGHTIPLANVLIHKDTLGTAASLTTGYLDIGGLTGLSAGASQAETFKLWITVPSPQDSGSYTYTLYVQVVISL